MSGRQSLNAVIARMTRDGTLSPLPPPSDQAATPLPPEVFGPPEAAALVPGHPRLTYGGLAEWERTRREVAERNAALLAQSVAQQKAEIAAAKEPTLARAQASLAAELSTWRSVEQSRIEARRWAAEHRDAADRMREYQDAAEAKARTDDRVDAPP